MYVIWFKWFEKILFCYLILLDENGEVTYNQLVEKVTSLNINSFKTNFTQMVNIAPKNHAKVFEVKGNKIYLWNPVKDFILEQYKNFKILITQRDKK